MEAYPASRALRHCSRARQLETLPILVEGEIIDLMCTGLALKKSCSRNHVLKIRQPPKHGRVLVVQLSQQNLMCLSTCCTIFLHWWEKFDDGLLIFRVNCEIMDQNGTNRGESSKSCVGGIICRGTVDKNKNKKRGGGDECILPIRTVFL